MKIKRIEDYYDEVQNRFPDLTRQEIDKILKHGMRSFFTLNARGADVLIKSDKWRFVMYFGKLFNNSEVARHYFVIKWKIKLRLKYILKNPPFDGYYYVGISDELYKKHFSNKKGRLKSKIEFPELIGYKIKEEAFIAKKYNYFVKVKIEDEKYFIVRKNDFSSRDVTLIAKRDKSGKIININE